MAEISMAVHARGLDDPLVMIGMMLLIVGFGFKVSAVPFHMWTPDVYQGSPTSVTAFMAVASKAVGLTYITVPSTFFKKFSSLLSGIFAYPANEIIIS